MIRYDYLKKLQKWGMNLTPVRSDKKPVQIDMPDEPGRKVS